MNTSAKNEQVAARITLTYAESSDFKVISRMLPEGLPLITISGRVTGVEAAALTDRFCHLYAGIPGNILVDLSTTTFFSSIALGFIYNLADQRKQEHGALMLIGAHQQIHKMLYMMGMGDYFQFVETLDEALAFSKSV